MKKTQTQDVNMKTQTGSATASGATARLLPQGRTIGGGLLPKAGVLGLLLGLSLGTGLLVAGEEPQYRFIAVPLPGPGESFGINDDGLATGAYVDPVTGDWLSFLFEDGKLIDGIAGPGSTDTFLGPANNLDVEGGNIGDYTNQVPVFHDIRRGTYALLPEIPGMPLNFGDGINDLGHGVGVAFASGDVDDGGNGLGMNWFWDGKHYSFFTVPGAVDGATVGGINDWDQISGYYVDSTGTPHGFVKDGSKFTTLDVPGAAYTIAFGINNLGVVSGLYVNADTSHHGFFWSQGKFTTVDVNIDDANGTLWYGSNDQGDLAGIYFTGSTHAQNAVIAVRLDGGCVLAH
jgi:hypothetical protein